MKCSCDCIEEAVIYCQWGSDKLPFQEANLCQEHLDEFWDTLNPLLQLNMAWCTFDKPTKEIK